MQTRADAGNSRNPVMSVALPEAVVREHRGGEGRKHHRRHHHDPDVDVEAERPEGHARRRVHPSHPVARDQPGHDGEDQERPEQDQPRPVQPSRP
jgi:hypothetical protein